MCSQRLRSPRFKPTTKTGQTEKEGKTEAWSLRDKQSLKLPLFHTYPHESIHFKNLFLILQHTIARIVKHFKQTNRRKHDEIIYRPEIESRILCAFIASLQICKIYVCKKLSTLFQRKIESR